jgi:hypothetical protein
LASFLLDLDQKRLPTSRLGLDPVIEGLTQSSKGRSLQDK